MSSTELKTTLKRRIDELNEQEFNAIQVDLFNILDPVDEDTGLRHSKLMALLEEAEEDVKQGKVIKDHERMLQGIRERVTNEI